MIVTYHRLAMSQCLVTSKSLVFVSIRSNDLPVIICIKPSPSFNLSLLHFFVESVRNSELVVLFPIASDINVV